MAGRDVDDFLHELDQDQIGFEAALRSVGRTPPAQNMTVPSLSVPAPSQAAAVDNVVLVGTSQSTASASHTSKDTLQTSSGTSSVDWGKAQDVAGHDRPLKQTKVEPPEMSYVEKPDPPPQPAARPAWLSSRADSQGASFKVFLEKEEQDKVVRLHREVGEGRTTPIGIHAFDVLDRERWWEHVKMWFEDTPDTWTEKAFFMVLRRQGMRPLNRSLPSIGKGYDYGLKRIDVETHGYMFDEDVYAKYNRTSAQRQASVAPGPSAAGGEGRGSG